MRIALFVFLLLTVNVSAQTRRFRNELQRLLQLEDSVFAISAKLQTGEDRVSIHSAEAMLRDNIIALCQKQSKRVEFQESKTLNLMAHSCMKFFSEKKFAKSKKTSLLRREVRRLRHAIIARFGIINVFSFNVPLYESNKGGYFYDRKGPLGDPNLYKGDKKKLKKKLEKDEELEYIPLDGLKLDEINKLILKKLSKKSVLLPLKKSVYSYIGLDVQLISKTLNRTQIPHARVVLFLGARRLQKLKV